MKKGFTLAEVLITLAIIGIVAALTIPTVIAKFQQRELYTRFMESYNIFSNAYAQLRADGLINERWSTRDENIPEEILSKIKYTVKCEADDTTCFGGGNIYHKSLNGTLNENIYTQSSRTLYLLPNGANFQIQSAANGSSENGVSAYTVSIDTDGIKKGPNTWGRDIFKLYFYPHQASPGFDSNCYKNFNSVFIGDNPTFKPLEFNTNSLEYLCDPNSGDIQTGYCCGARMLLEGKMDY